MNTRLISIIIGSVLVLGVGTLVYKTKQPVAIPLEDATPGVTTDLTGISPVQTQTGVSGGSQTVIKKTDLDDDEGDDDDRTTSTVTTTPTPTPTTSTQPGTGGITLAQIAKHNTRSSCWSAINGSVYDLTSWIPNHPGGEQAILSLCGLDGSSGYNGQHGGAAKPARMLAGFKIGTLSK